jgi:hypothetical protein
MAYNTTPFHGKVARIEKNNVPVDFSISYSLNVTIDMSDKSPQGDNWKSALPGLAGATGIMEYFFVPGNTEQKALIDTIVTASPGVLLTDIKFLLNASTNAFTGNIWVTGFSVNTTMGDIVKGSFPFQLDGALALTDAA